MKERSHFYRSIEYIKMQVMTFLKFDMKSVRSYIFFLLNFARNVAYHLIGLFMFISMALVAKSVNNKGDTSPDCMYYCVDCVNADV